MSRRAEGGVRPLPEAFRAFPWALSTAAAADLANLPPDRILRFDGNTPPAAPPYARPETVAAALAQVHAYPHGGHERIHDAIAAYAGVEPENVVL
nr:hypothetical protein [Actinomycetota bacterium]